MIFWDPPREAFTIPYLDVAIYWYSIFFAFGFLVGYYVVRKLLKPFFISHPKELSPFVDRLAWYMFIGTLIGARLGHVLFYEPAYYWDHPIEIFFVRQGGLASHGAAVGVVLALWLFWKHPGRNHGTLSSPLQLLDMLAVAAAFTGGCIRIGNFFNQEIQGTSSTLPWAVTFGHPVDGGLDPTHPVVIYEAIAYFLIFGILMYITRKNRLLSIRPGRIIGLFFILVFGFRFFIEFFKLPQETFSIPYITMGQLLSVPFIILGLYFFKRK